MYLTTSLYFHMLRLTHGQMGIEPLCQKVLFVLIPKKKKYCCLLCFEMLLDSATFAQQVVISAPCNFVFMISNLTIIPVKVTMYFFFFFFCGETTMYLTTGFAHWSKWWNRLNLLKFIYIYIYIYYIDSIFCLEKNLPSNHFVGKFL